MLRPKPRLFQDVLDWTIDFATECLGEPTLHHHHHHHQQQQQQERLHDDFASAIKGDGDSQNSDEIKFATKKEESLVGLTSPLPTCQDLDLMFKSTSEVFEQHNFGKTCQTGFQSTNVKKSLDVEKCLLELKPNFEETFSVDDEWEENFADLFPDLV